MLIHHSSTFYLQFYHGHCDIFILFSLTDWYCINIDLVLFCACGDCKGFNSATKYNYSFASFGRSQKWSYFLRWSKREVPLRCA